jgi:hypothetical protein
MSQAAFPSTPYKGLAPYGQEDAAYFFGRESEQEVIASNLLASRLTLLYGPSGVGKSSVLRAGVNHRLQEIARQNLTEQGRPEFAVVIFSSWVDDPVVGLVREVQEAIAKALSVPTHDSLPAGTSLSDTLAILAERAGGEIFIILDQFEEYFLYLTEEDREGSFAVEFPRAVNRTDLRVNFLLSIREDALAKLDRFKGRIAGLFKNYLRIDQLDREAARRAITKPIEIFNETGQPAAQPVTIEPELVESVLDQVEGLEEELGQGGRGGVAKSHRASIGSARIEAPYLQLVLTRIWDKELGDGSRVLRRATLDRLEGAKKIVRTHLEQVMAGFGKEEGRVASRIFKFLVTPSGSKIAYSLEDLAYHAELRPEQVKPVLTKLTSPKMRVLRVVAASGNQSERYEIFHDALAPAILGWRTRYMQEQDRSALAGTERIINDIISKLLTAGFRRKDCWVCSRKLRTTTKAWPRPMNPQNCSIEDPVQTRQKGTSFSSKGT